MESRKESGERDDRSNGYEQVAESFLSRRNSGIGAAVVREWIKKLARGSSVLDLGCGNGIPITQVLMAEGLSVYGVDASAKMIAAFQERFPDAQAECSAAEDSRFFGRTFDGVVAWGLLFLMSAESQELVIGKVSRALNPGGLFLFTSPREAVTWTDSLTGRKSLSLGFQEYQKLLLAEGLELIGEETDEGENHYYFVAKL